VFCDQTRCKKYGVDPSKDIPVLMREIGRWSEVRRVKVCNVDRAARGSGYGREVDVEEVERRMVESFGKGSKVPRRGSGREEEAHVPTDKYGSDGGFEPRNHLPPGYGVFRW